MLRYYKSENVLINHTYVTTKQMSNPAAHAFTLCQKGIKPSSLNNGHVRMAVCSCTPLQYFDYKKSSTYWYSCRTSIYITLMISNNQI